MSEANRRPRVPVAGIGASAGGIHALQELFSALPDKLGIAVAVIVHLHPEHDSDLAGILASRTALRVVQVCERMPLTAETVYVIPPNRRLLITENDIETAPFDEPRGHRAPIDLFFRSLAEQHGDGFAIVLSGGGSDGAVGVRAVREQGGLILVQDPAEAEFPSMPRSAIASGADFVLPVRELAKKLVELIHVKTSQPQGLNDSDEDVLLRILAHVRSRKGQDFSKYKRPTVMRRLGRRMQVTQAETLASYLAFLKDNPPEVDALFNDLLISVTSFFRDPDAFTALTLKVITKLVVPGPAEQTIRVWVPGCATGEEAYSIAILLLEEAARREARPTIQVFASDLDVGALAVAREGRYPSAIAADVSEERLARFFTPEGDRYRIRSEVRDLIVFASHSLLRDPPFTRMDLVSCRNLLIYLDRELQQQVITTCNYSLVPGGYLFLGASETADTAVGLFRSVDRDARIFQASDRPREKLPPLSGVLTGLRVPAATDSSSPARPGAVTDAVVHRQALEDWAPPSILVDESQRILNLSETAGRYVLHPSGPMTSDAAEVVRPELKQELRAALFRAFQHSEPSVTLPIPVRFNGTPQLVVLHVRPVVREAGQRVALVLFVEGGKAHGASGNQQHIGESSEAITNLREELQATRTLLSTTREQYDAAIEELRAANEELQSINEEYRSTAEELETSKEELQSINEELQTLNGELKVKLDMVTTAHNDIQNLMSATDIGTLFLDRAMHIRRFTPRITDLFSIRAGDEGRPLTNFSHTLDYEELVVDARKVLGDLEPIERSIRSGDGRWYTTRLRPYRTLDDKIDGVVVTFFDVTDRRNADAAWAARQKVLLDELTHRVKNTLSVVQAVIRMTLRDNDVAQPVVTALEARIHSLAQSHDLLVQSEWRGASLEALARQQLAPYLDGNVDRLALTGPSVIVPPAIATPLGLILHELSTNAAKHGALSVAAGRVSLDWQVRDAPDGGRRLDLRWIERGGPVVSKPRRRGSGSSLIENALSRARVERKFLAVGLECSIEVPLILHADEPLTQDAPRSDS